MDLAYRVERFSGVSYKINYQNFPLFLTFTMKCVL